MDSNNFYEVLNQFISWYVDALRSWVQFFTPTLDLISPSIFDYGFSTKIGLGIEDYGVVLVVLSVALGGLKDDIHVLSSLRGAFVAMLWPR